MGDKIFRMHRTGEENGGEASHFERDGFDSKDETTGKPLADPDRTPVGDTHRARISRSFPWSSGRFDGGKICSLCLGDMPFRGRPFYAWTEDDHCSVDRNGGGFWYHGNERRGGLRTARDEDGDVLYGIQPRGNYDRPSNS